MCLAAMTLDEYIRVGPKDSLTYWVESRLDEIDSSWGPVGKRDCVQLQHEGVEIHQLPRCR